MYRLLKKDKILIIFLLTFIYFNLYGKDFIKLSPPCYKGNVTLEETLKERRSVREFSSYPLNLQEISQLL
ncbi:hypothetical protein TOPB45_0570 [Thermodesulfobacterium geofontis OPF15]|jgi:hypothetical protein|uniref:Uncharacterized protein n=1 Tax=Thermodesulfobacterium geofontis (strain OPF15) TaxID=795359 RepID=F8C4K6_THEGP|nr:hypothetical protein [Thermodesulfobacterium geofontis]AEH22672.1 hypothetical protein TOPB45_0570 [Thermodesulfobacterium geofontis OPF15]